MVHPLRGFHHRVGAEGPKRGCRWRTCLFCFGVARRPLVLPVRRNHPLRSPDAADQWGARRYPRRPSLQACRNTVAPSNDAAGLRDQGGRYPTAPQELRLALAGGRGCRGGTHRISFADVYTMHRSDQQSCPRSDRRTGMLTVRSWGGVRVPKNGLEARQAVTLAGPVDGGGLALPCCIGKDLIEIDPGGGCRCGRNRRVSAQRAP
jgi:hypothetical protein